jgi:dethiobiotin synthetase
VGKTYVGGSITRTLHAAGHRVGVYKPVASGCRREGVSLVADDALALWLAAGQPRSLADVCPQMFEAPLAPHLAAHAEHRQVDRELLRRGIEPWCDSCDIVIVEGAGGLMSPLSDADYVADLAADFGYPLIVVAPNMLGVINQTLQTLITASVRNGLQVAAVILNDLVPPSPADPSTASNEQELRQRTATPILCRVKHGGSVDAGIDWYRLSS